MMALVLCSECHKEISEKAKACPHCGFAPKPKQGIIARIVRAVILLFLLFVGLVAFLTVRACQRVEHTFDSSMSEHRNPGISNTVSSCKIDDITIIHTKAKFVDHCKTRQCITLEGVGALNNACSEPVGVQVKITALDKDGLPLSTAEMWPASIRNIPPGSYEFSINQWLSYDPGAKSFTLTPIDIRKY